MVAHELTHGVTQFTSGLLYYYHAGAINESMSDVMGELFDQSNAGPPAGNDSAGARWLLGEDLPIGAIRNMANPPQFDQPDSMTSPLWDPLWWDNGGVHQNNGVWNKAAFLMRDGVTFNGVTVAAITDPVKVAKIWLEAHRLLTLGADYADLAYALQPSCQNLGSKPNARRSTRLCSR